MSKMLPAAVPAAAMMLLRFIYQTETHNLPPTCYEVIYGHNQDKLDKPLTRMTVGEVIDEQRNWTKRFKSSAAGAAQFMRATLIGIANEVSDLSGEMMFDGELQDRLAYHLLLRRGYARFIAGRMAVIEFGKALAQEWASFPVLADCQGSERKVRRGQSYYAGDGLNKALIEPAEVERMLRKVLQAAKSDPQNVPVPLPKPENDNPAPKPAPVPDPRVRPEDVDPEKLDKPIAKSKTVWMWLYGAVTAILTGLKELNLVALDWRVQLALLAVIVLFAAYAIKRRADIAKVYRNLKDEIGA